MAVANGRRATSWENQQAITCESMIETRTHTPVVTRDPDLSSIQVNLMLSHC